MKDKKKIVELDTYMPVFREILSQGKEVSLTITGNSMSPFLVHGRDKILISPPDGSWKKIIFYNLIEKIRVMLKSNLEIDKYEKNRKSIESYLS